MNNEDLRFVVEDGKSGRADQVVGDRFPQASRKRLAALFAAGHVRVEGKKVKKGQYVREGQRVELASAPLDDASLRVTPEARDIVIAYQDAQILVVQKPSGMASHPLRAGELGSIANAIVAQFPECAQVGEDPREAGLAHRLDTDTTGLLIVARDQESWQALRDAFAEGTIEKTYWAVVEGRPIGSECHEPLLQRSKKVVIDYAGLEAHTSWQELARGEDFTLVRCTAHTGRMHQIRAHLAYCGSPIAGDQVYGGHAQEGFEGHFLHAAQIAFPHPLTGKRMEFQAELPAERAAWLASHGLAAAPSAQNQ